MSPCLVLRVFALFVLFGAALLAQEKPSPKDEDEVAKLGPVDPYTGGDKAVMAQAGVVAYGPFPWADHHSTTDIDRVLGERRILWLETAHFKIGSSLKSTAWPEHADAKKFLQDEVKALRKKLPKVPEKPKKLDPWLRLHLYAQRCEKAYAECQLLLGVTDADFPDKGKLPREGQYLGLPGKFLLLTFQKQSDMGRYMDRFCNRKVDKSMRFYHDKTYQMLLAVAAEGLDGIDESGLHAHVLFATWQNLINGYNGYAFPLPLWFGEGVCHWYARKVPTEFLSVQVRDDEAIAEEKQHNWPVKVRRRAQHDGTWFPFDDMANWAKWEEMGYHAHSQSWSRLDYLMQLDREKVGLMLRQMKAVPSDGTFEGQAPALRTMAQKLLFELFELDGPTFDTRWREWVLKTYPKK